MNLIQAFKKFGERITTYIDGVMPKALSEIENDLYYPESKEFLCKITTSNCTYTYDGGDVCIGSHSCDLTEDVVEAINKIGDTYSLYIEYTYNGISGVFNNLTNPDDIYCLLGETSADGCLMLKPRTSGGFYFSQERYQTTAMPFIFSIYLVKNAKTIDSDCVDTTIPRINAAEVGQLVSVKSTDANGVPTEWESVDNFSGSWNDLTDKPFYSEEQETWLLDKTELVYEDTNVRYARISVEAFDVFDVVGNIIKVFWDGTYYDCEILYDETNDHKYVVFDNFTAYLEADTLYITTTDNISETHEFGFFIVDEQLKLDENFIPDIIARTEDIPTEMVMYSEQELTEEQQMQARKNLGLYHNSKEPLTLWNNDDTPILSGEVVATNVKSLSNYSVYIYNKHKELIYTVNSSDMNHITRGNQWSGYEWVYGNTSFLSDDGYEHLGAIDTTVDTGEPIAIYNCDSGAGYYSGGHLFVLNDDYLETKDRDKIYYVVIKDATNTETVYKQIPMEYLPSDVMKHSEFTTEYTPTEDYHPTTKKYVDDKAPLIVTFTGTGTEKNPWTCNVTYEEIMTAISVGRSVEYYAENLLYNSGIIAIKAQLIPSNDDWYVSIILRIIDSNWLIGYDADNNIFVEKYQKLVSFDDLSNKPFCEYTDYEVLASIVCESEESSCEVGADFLEEGKTYHVAINTEEDIDGYVVLCSSYVNATYGLFCNYLGDTTPMGLAKNSEYGFIIYKENASDDIYIILDTDRYTLPCEVVISEPVTKVKTLDEKYLPDDVMKRSEFIMNWEDIENRPFYTYDGWKSVLSTTVESASTTISTSENLLEEGVTYCVDWENNDDGDSYKFECMYYHNATMGADVYYLGGNPVTETAATSDNGIIIYQNSSTDTITILVDETTISLPCAITISKLVEKVKTLDDVFIPQDVLRARAMDFTDDEKEIARNNIDAASTQDIEDHNSSSTSHADIRELITSLQNQISELTSKISTLEQKTIALTDDGEGNVTIS